VVSDPYVPAKGDLVVLTFDPQSGHEQQGRRPALIISNDLFNRHTGMCFACPITNTDRGFPFHVAVPAGHAVTGFMMIEQLKSLDYRARKARRIGKVPPEVLDEALAMLDACLF
jgi:mRNA interferase MazF